MTDSPGLQRKVTNPIATSSPAPPATGAAPAAGTLSFPSRPRTRREVLSRAEIGSARQVVIAVNRDDTAVLIALTARQLNPRVTITAAVREEENQDLLRLSGADQVVVSSGAAGQLLAISAARRAVGRVIAGLLDRGRGLELAERLVAAAEVGTPARDADGTVIALVRGDDVLPADHPVHADSPGVTGSSWSAPAKRPIIGHDITEPREFAHASHHI